MDVVSFFLVALMGMLIPLLLIVGFIVAVVYFLKHYLPSLQSMDQGYDAPEMRQGLLDSLEETKRKCGGLSASDPLSSESILERGYVLGMPIGFYVGKDMKRPAIIYAYRWSRMLPGLRNMNGIILVNTPRETISCRIESGIIRVAINDVVVGVIDLLAGRIEHEGSLIGEFQLPIIALPTSRNKFVVTFGPREAVLYYSPPGLGLFGPWVIAENLSGLSRVEHALVIAICAFIRTGYTH